MKKCSKCKVEKIPSEFGRDRQRKDGLHPSCKSCRSLSVKLARKGWGEEEREKEREYNRRPERKAAHAVLTKKWAARNKDKTRASLDKYRLSEKGIKTRSKYKKSDANKQSAKRYVERNRVKIRAQKKARRAVEIGILTKTGCEVCGAVKVQGHHPDYKEPLVVMWLCPSHHSEWHRLNGPGLNGD